MRDDSADSIISRAFCRISSRAFVLQRPIRDVAGDEESQHEDAEQDQVEFPDELHAHSSRRRARVARASLGPRRGLRARCISPDGVCDPRTDTARCSVRPPAELGIAQAAREAPLEHGAIAAGEPGLGFGVRDLVIHDERRLRFDLRRESGSGSKYCRGIASTNFFGARATVVKGAGSRSFPRIRPASLRARRRRLRPAVGS